MNSRCWIKTHTSRELPIKGRAMDYKIPLDLTPQDEGGYTVTSPLLPELVTEGDSISQALSRKVGDRGVNPVNYREVARKLTIFGCRELRRQGGGSHRKWVGPRGVPRLFQTGVAGTLN